MNKNLQYIIKQYTEIAKKDAIIDIKNKEIQNLAQEIREIKQDKSLDEAFVKLFNNSDSFKFEKPFHFELSFGENRAVSSTELCYTLGTVSIVYKRNGHTKYSMIEDHSPITVLRLLNHIQQQNV